MSVYSTGPDPTPRDCREAYLNGSRKDGVYTIDPGCGKTFNVFCNMTNGGWTVFQSRMDLIDFKGNYKYAQYSLYLVTVERPI